GGCPTLRSCMSHIFYKSLAETTGQLFSDNTRKLVIRTEIIIKRMLTFILKERLIDTFSYILVNECLRIKLFVVALTCFTRQTAYLFVQRYRNLCKTLNTCSELLVAIRCNYVNPYMSDDHKRNAITMFYRSHFIILILEAVYFSLFFFFPLYMMSISALDVEMNFIKRNVTLPWLKCLRKFAELMRRVLPLIELGSPQGPITTILDQYHTPSLICQCIIAPIAVSRVLFLHKHDCSALRQQLRLLLKRLSNVGKRSL
ncbi:hypothetical protein L9F63_019510, partial [Diploptera punctata]